MRWMHQLAYVLRGRPVGRHDLEHPRPDQRPALELLAADVEDVLAPALVAWRGAVTETTVLPTIRPAARRRPDVTQQWPYTLA